VGAVGLGLALRGGGDDITLTLKDKGVSGG
jgi:hypothetical protein